MLFHPTFKAEKEQRLIFQQGAPTAAPGEGAPSAAEVTDEQKTEADEVIEVLKNDPEMAAALVEFNVETADKDTKKFQEAYHVALVSAATALFNSITDGTDETKLATVNTVFTNAKAQVTFKWESGQMVIAAETPAAEPEKKDRELTKSEKDMVEDAFSSNPEMKSGAERLVASLKPGNPELQVAQDFFDNFNGKNPAEKKAILTNNPAFQKFMQELPADQQKFVNQLRQAAMAVDKELSDEERTDKLDGAKKWLLDKKFDASKASEIDKNLVLVQLQMRGIDTNNAEEIFTDPSKMKVFEGSPMERGFNQIMGLIGYVLLSIEKMKGMLKPGEKAATGAEKGADKTPEAKKAAEVATGREAARKMLKESNETNLSEVITVKESEKDQIAKQIDGNPAAGPADEKNGFSKRLEQAKGRQAAAKQKVDILEKESEEEKKANANEITKAKEEYGKATGAVEGLQKQLDNAQAAIGRLDEEMKVLKEAMKQTRDLTKNIRDACLRHAIVLQSFIDLNPDANTLYDGIAEMATLLPSENELDMEFSTMRADPQSFLRAWHNLGGDIAASGIDPETGVFKDPTAFLQQLEILVSKVTDQKVMLKERGFPIGQDGEIDFSRVTNKQLADEFETIEKLVPNGDLMRKFSQVLTDRIGSGLTPENEPLFMAIIRAQTSELSNADAMDAARYFAQNNLPIRLDTDRIFVADFTQDRAAKELQKTGLSEYIQKIFKQIKGGHSIRLF